MKWVEPSRDSIYRYADNLITIYKQEGRFYLEHICPDGEQCHCNDWRGYYTEHEALNECIEHIVFGTEGDEEEEGIAEEGIKFNIPEFELNYLSHPSPVEIRIIVVERVQRRKTKNALLRANDSKHTAWAIKIKHRDNYKCQECGSEKRLEAHHIKNWNDFKELRYDMNNGITLCKKCHGKLK